MDTLISIILIYFSINSFIAGYHLCNDILWARDKAGKWVAVLTSLFMVFFGVIFYILYTIIILLEIILDKVNVFIPIKFWFLFFIFRKWRYLEENELNMINKLSSRYGKGLWSHKVARYCTRLVNQRNNFIYKPGNETTF